MSEQQTWIITFNSDSDDVDYQASTLQEFLLRASFDIKVIQKPKSEHTQGGWVDLVITLVGAGGVTRGLGALAFSTSLASTFEAFVLFLLLSRRIGNFDLQDFRTFLVRVCMASGAMGIMLFVIQFLLDHMIDTTSMQKLFIPGIFKALVKLFIELGLGSSVFLVAARLLKLDEMNTGLVRRVINLLHIPWL